jgi:hypothetical protein
MKLSLEIIYKRKQSTKQSRFGVLDRQSVLIKEKRKRFYLMSDRVSKRLKRKHLLYSQTVGSLLRFYWPAKLAG